MTDPQIVRAVVAWAIGLLVLATVGVGVPVIASFVPDAVGYGRRHGDWKPLAAISGLAVGVVVLTVFESSYLGAPASPSKVLWGSLTLLLIVASSTAAGGYTISRAFKRRADRRVALEAVSKPPESRMASSGAGLQPAPVERLNARGAEYLACEWMRWLGIDDALVTPEQRDGGVDVRSREFLAQVKHLVNEPTGVAAIRQLHGVAAAEGRRALFFTSSSYTRDAVAFARSVHMALFVVRVADGRLVPHGVAAQQVWLHGASNVPAIGDHRPAPAERVAR